MSSRLTAAESVALALAYGRGTEGPVADAIPTGVWDALHERGLLKVSRDFTGEGTTVATEDGALALIQQIGVVSHEF